MSAAAAVCRDISGFHTHQPLHSPKYNIDAALTSMVSTTGCRDEIEDWSSSKVNRLEEAI